MTENIIDIIPIEALKNFDFYIPNYQRGYRWREQQVFDLLNDIQDFRCRADRGDNEFYCIQPLVVKPLLEESDDDLKTRLHRFIQEEECTKSSLTKFLKSLNRKWEVIDGQQRLTTIFIILSVLGLKSFYQINYQTRRDSAEFLNNIQEEKAGDNIDFYHIFKAKRAIEDWFRDKGDIKENFTEVLLKSVRFIWCKTKEEDAIKVFTRLNIGKIPLTNAELIKALFLNQSNFSSEELHLKQQEIALEWDNIEYRFQDSSFWLFFNNMEDERVTRIDFLFDFIVSNNLLELDYIDTDNEEARNFLYFYQYYKENKEDFVEKSWDTTKSLFELFNSWYEDTVCYHYIGYLRSLNTKGTALNSIYDMYTESNSKDEFIQKLKAQIRKVLTVKDLNYKYNKDGSDKTKSRSLLLLHNVQTILDQNKGLNLEYGASVSYRFPFHLFKSEKWDIEHIAPSSPKDLGDSEKKEWLSFHSLIVGDEIREQIEKSKDAKSEDLDLLIDLVKDKLGVDKELDDENRNQIGNYCLLDSSTNRSYGNAMFAVKRHCIIEKVKGKQYRFNKTDKTFNLTDSRTAFVPPCTQKVFFKSYSLRNDGFGAWYLSDSEAYKVDIKDTLADFLEDN